MPNFYLSVESTTSLLGQMKETHNAIKMQIESLRNKIDATVGYDWIMPGASQFQEEYEQWRERMQVLLGELETLADKLDREIQEWTTIGAVIDSPPPDFSSSRLIREWWHSILRNHGRYSSYAILLMLPSDKEAARYFKEFGRELDLISGKNCLVLAFGDSGIRRPGFEGESWLSTVDEHISKGYSVRVADWFNIDFSTFPCLIVFNDIRVPEHIVITLKSLTTELIAEKLRLTFSTIKKAVEEKRDPLKSIDVKRKEEGFHAAGKSIVSEIRSFAGKTIEMVVEAAINANIK